MDTQETITVWEYILTLPSPMRELTILITIAGFFCILWDSMTMLMEDVYPELKSIIQKMSKTDVFQNDHLITQLVKKKSNNNFITYFSLLIAFSGEYVVYAQTPETSVLWTMLFTFFMLLFSFINREILKYRVKHGLYGTSYSEAREIVAFILEWHRKNGNSNGKPPKLVFTKEELDECLQVNGGEEYAG